MNYTTRMPPPEQRGRSVTREVLLGFVRVHILHHAAERPVYGLWLIEELGHHGYRLSAGTLYPILHNLTSQGLLRRRDQQENGKIRKYYSLTPKGRRALADMRGKLKELVEEVFDHPGPQATRKP
jgi:PadR family transcriptional regulator PadR